MEFRRVLFRSDQDLALKIVDEIDLSFESADFEQIYQFLKRSEGRENQKVHSYWLSDFQKNSLTDPIEIDSSFQVFPVPIHPVETRNISIDSSWFDSPVPEANIENRDRKSTRLNSSHVAISYAVFCLKK